MALLDRLVHRPGTGGGATATAAIVWMIAFAIVGYFKTNFSCPRCGELYFRRFDARPWRRNWIFRPWARRCLHCELPKWADG
ncbi:MAG TPA: hypothetical protein VFA27_01415 [Vicinamibacterales bacterium]|nr:hypothetical protein [Vicinamibacterales bacterium]